MRRLHLLLVVLVAGGTALFAAPSAGAHAQLASATPADGVSLSSSPSAITLSFTEAPDPKLSGIDVLDTSGNPQAKGEASAEGNTLRVELESLDEGVYTVSWRALSSVDGHLTAGAYAFGVGVSPSEIASADVEVAAVPTLSAAEVAGRVVLYLGLFLLLGAGLVFGFLVRGPAGRARGIAVAGVVASLAGLMVLAVAQRSSAGVPFGDLLPTPIGRALLGRGVAIAVAALAVAIAIVTSRRIAWDLASVAAGAAIYVHSAAGHPAAGGLVLAKVVTQFAHFAAAGVWMGGLAVLLFAIRGVEPSVRTAAVRRYSTVAGVMLFVVAGTGTARAVQEVGSWGALFTTGYGRAVLGKVLGVIVLGALGAIQRYRSLPEVGQRPKLLAKIGRAELVTAAALLVLAALLASLAPSKSSAVRPRGVTVSASDFGRSVRATLEITPGQAGVNLFRVTLDVERGAPPKGVSVRLTLVEADLEPSMVELERIGDAFEARGSAIGTTGRWRAVLVVDRGADTVEIPLRFHTACPQGTIQTVDDIMLTTVDLGAGRSVQMYIDPGKAGNNDVHFTFFDANGDELPLADEGRVEAIRGDDVQRLDAKHLTPGHVFSGGRLRAGDWLFDFTGETKSGDRLNVCFEETVD